MKKSNFKSFTLIAFLTVYLLAALTSCTANRPNSAWMDLPHARQLDHKKSKHIQKHASNSSRRHHY